MIDNLTMNLSNVVSTTTMTTLKQYISLKKRPFTSDEGKNIIAYIHDITYYSGALS